MKYMQKIPFAFVCTQLLIVLAGTNVRVEAFSAGVTPGSTIVQNSPTAINTNDNLSSSPSEAQVIEAAKCFMQNTGYFNPMDESLFADDFIFRGPVIGPLNKNDYKDVLNYFSIYKAFPDISPNCFAFGVDPEDPLRVWYQLRATGTYTKPLGGPVGLVIKPDGQNYRGSTETWSLTFDESLKARLLTAGYVSDRFEDRFEESSDNVKPTTTGGIGLSFGILKTLGLSIPSGVGNPILELIQATNGPLVTLGISPKAMSKEEDVPKWWKSEKRGAES